MLQNYLQFNRYGWLVIILIMAWTLPWKIAALWRASKHNDKVWFVVLLVVNTLAVLDILYIYVFSRRKSLLEKIKDRLK